MITAIGNSNNSIQMINALNAFKANREIETKSNGFNFDTPDGINLQDNDNLLDKIDLGDVKNCAQKIGENITNEDIKYGLTYGRSVIADFMA